MVAALETHKGRAYFLQENAERFGAKGNILLGGHSMCIKSDPPTLLQQTLNESN